MRTETKVVLELLDYFVTISFRPKNPPKANNDNKRYDLWNDELRELFDKYDK